MKTNKLLNQQDKIQFDFLLITIQTIKIKYLQFSYLFTCIHVQKGFQKSNHQIYKNFTLKFYSKNMENSLIKNNLRSVISLVDKLRDIKLQEYIKLPKIVAVGSQSSGKSSLIEQVVGLDILPRGSGVVTRRPLQIRMVYQPDLKQPYATFDELPNQKFTNFAKVKQSIEQLTDKVCGKNKNIVDKAIVLNIYSPNCPNLTIIDLPGLTRISLESQVQNIHEVTQKMIRKYMVEENTIILCVVPANQDITNDEVLHMARQIDVKGERTIGCVTKIDIMDRGTDARALLMNKGEVPLKLGFVGIKNRSQADINENKTIQVKQSLEEEKMYFSKSPIYSSLPRECLGTTSLVDKMTKVLESCIINYLPTLLQKIRQKKTALNQKIKQYGKPLPKSLAQKQTLLWQICNDYINNYKNSIRNGPSQLKSSERIQKVSIHIHQQLQKFLQQQSNHSLNQQLSDKKIHFSLKKFDTINTLGFPSMNSFLYLLNPILNNLKLPMQNSLNHLCDQVNHLAQLIAGDVAFEFKQFREYIISRNSEIINEFRRKANTFLHNMLECEVKGVTYQKLDFDRKIDQTKLTELEIKNPLIPILRKSIISYYDRCVYNLRQLIPKNFSYLILGQATKKIQFQIFQTCVQSQVKIEKWLELSSYSIQQRISNEKQFDVIQKAEQHILTYGGFSKGVALKKTKKREERERQMKEAMEKQKQRKAMREQKMIEHRKEIQSSKFLKKQQPKSQTKTQVSDTKPKPKGPEPEPAKNDHHHNAKKEQKPVEKPKDKPVVSQQKQNVFAQLFGSADTKKKEQVKEQKKQQKKPSPPKIPPSQTSARKPIFPNDPFEQQQIPPQQSIKQTYNNEMGKATDKAVDEMFKNQRFQQQSKKAVQKGTSYAIQKQFGVSEDTANSFGKGAGLLWGNEKVQNAAKDQAKKQAREKTLW